MQLSYTCIVYTLYLWEEWSVVFLELAAPDTQLLEGFGNVLASTGGVRSEEATAYHEENLREGGKGGGREGGRERETKKDKGRERARQWKKGRCRKWRRRRRGKG